jgi:hypothetical protein
VRPPQNWNHAILDTLLFAGAENIDSSTTNMNDEKLKNHRPTLKTFEKNLNFVEATTEEEEDLDGYIIM